MRTTIYLDDRLAEQFRRAAAERELSLSAFLAEAGRAALQAKSEPDEPFALVTYGKEGLQPGVTLDRTNELLVAEDHEQFGTAE